MRRLPALAAAALRAASREGAAGAEVAARRAAGAAPAARMPAARALASTAWTGSSRPPPGDGAAAADPAPDPLSDPLAALTSLLGDLAGADTDGEADDLREELMEAALAAVPEHGWTETALAAGAASLGLSPAAGALAARGEVDLVLWFVRRCNKGLVEAMRERKEELTALPGTTARVAAALRWRLEMVAPYSGSWHQALAVLARPAAAGGALKELASLSDAVWAGLGDASTDASWYTRRASLAAAYAACELHLAADASPGHADTWASIPRRLADVAAAGSAVRAVVAPLQAAAAWGAGARDEAARACGGARFGGA
jgi:ubiquinone biosynthesis protein COQ9